MTQALTINFKYKYFHKSVDWSSVNPCMISKSFKIKGFRLKENTFVKLSRP